MATLPRLLLAAVARDRCGSRARPVVPLHRRPCCSTRTPRPHPRPPGRGPRCGTPRESALPPWVLARFSNDASDPSSQSRHLLSSYSLSLGVCARPVSSPAPLQSQRSYEALQPGRMPDDVASSDDRHGWRSMPARLRAVGEVGIPDDRTGRAQVSCLVVRKPAPCEPIAVPEARHSWVVEHVARPSGAGVTCQQREPDGDDFQPCARVILKDVLRDPTGPDQADASRR